MVNYNLNAINISFTRLGENDKLLTVFAREVGLTKLVAKGAAKPGSKVAGRAELLVVNKLQVAKGKSIDIISQAETINANIKLRNNLNILGCALYHLELTKSFGHQLAQESAIYYDLLLSSLNILLDGYPLWYTLKFQMILAKMLGYEPQLSSCVVCQARINDHNLALFHYELGGVICKNCQFNRKNFLKENINAYEVKSTYTASNLVMGNYTHITPMILKQINKLNEASPDILVTTENVNEIQLIRTYQLYKNFLEFKIGKKFNGFEVLA